MTESKVKCISKKVADIFPTRFWKKVEVFNPGDELLQLEERQIMEILENFKDLFLDVWKERYFWHKYFRNCNCAKHIYLISFFEGIFSKFVIKRLEKYVSKTTK